MPEKPASRRICPTANTGSGSVDDFAKAAAVTRSYANAAETGRIPPSPLFRAAACALIALRGD